MALRERLFYTLKVLTRPSHITQYFPRVRGRGCRTDMQVLEELVTGDAELAPMNAVLGGVLANEILKVMNADSAQNPQMLKGGKLFLASMVM